MGDDFARALGLLLVFEGLMPFLSPRRFRESLMRAASMEDRPLRGIGLVAMLIGAGLLHWMSRS